MNEIKSLLKITLLLTLLCAFPACKETKKAEGKKIRGSKVLTNYVKVPMDKAKLGVKKVDRHNRQMQEQMDQLDFGQ